MGSTWATRLRVGLLLLGTAGLAQADLPVPPPMPGGPKPVPVTATVDFGPLAARIGARYVVQPKDTLLAVARRFSPDGGAWKAIAAANRAVLPDPDRLRVGEVLWVPPKARLAAAPAGTVTPAAAPGSDYALFWVAHRASRETLRHAQGTKIPEGVTPGAFTICLVPAESAGALLRVEDGATRPAGSTVATPGAASLAVPWPPVEYLGDDPTARLEVQVRLKSVEGSAIRADVDVVRLGADGGVMARKPPAPAVDPAPIPIARTATPGPADSPPATLPAAGTEPGHEPGRFPVLVGVLVALGGAFLVLLVWLVRSKPAPPPEA